MVDLVAKGAKMTKNHHYDTIIIGGGITATALFFTLAKYTNLNRVAMFEKYSDIATLNSHESSNSQTLHCGDIETNYTLEKAKEVKKAASMLDNYTKLYNLRDRVIFKFNKMALAVGDQEISYMKNRFEEFKNLYPYMEYWTKEQLAEIEPQLVNQREENISAMGARDSYCAINYSEVAKSFVKNAKDLKDNFDVYLNEEVINIEKKGNLYVITTLHDTYFANFVVVNAGAHSMLFAHKLGYAKELSCIPIGGSFYYTKEKVINSKIYTVQNPKLPFAAVHGDPDISNGLVRFGPTALVLPKLERYKHNHFIEFLQSLSPDTNTLKVFYDLLVDDDIRNYMAKNFLYEVPGIRRRLFAKEIQKIIPSMRSDDIEFAENVGGLRPQIIDKVQKKLIFSDGKITTNEPILFNVTPSPGATSCLKSAMLDSKLITKFLDKKFDEKRFNKELVTKNQEELEVA